MARTLDPIAYGVRRDAFVDAAHRLIATKGYQQMSIQDVLADVGASKGAFYHYFDSKASILEAVIDRMVETGIGRFGPAVHEPGRTALEKFADLFVDIAAYKWEQKDLILGFLRVWASDDNAVVREHLRRSMVPQIGPIFAAIVRQGTAEGAFRVADPDATARTLVSLLQGMQDDVGALFLDGETGGVTLEFVERRLAAYVEAFERILGAEPGTIRFGDPDTLRAWWLGPDSRRKESA